jgi:acylphosphatase
MRMNHPPPDSLRRRFRIHGRVQGVGFRAWCWQTGARLHLDGTVRNNPDGTVDVEAMGARDAMDALAQALAQGPRHARVDRVVELPPGADPLPGEFRIVG